MNLMGLVYLLAEVDQITEQRHHNDVKWRRFIDLSSQEILKPSLALKCTNLNFRERECHSSVFEAVFNKSVRKKILAFLFL